jgi:rRNA-processing protein FCF1
LVGGPSPRTDSNPESVTVVLLDTNFLLLPFQRHIDIFEEIERLIGGNVEFLVLSQVLGEIHYLIRSGTAKERRMATSSLQLVERFCRLVDESCTSTTGLDADTALMRYASNTGAVVATNDGELRRTLVKKGSRVIFLRKLAVLAITD